MKKIKCSKVEADNPLNWQQEDFDEVIYDFVNTRVLSGEPIPPAINKWYLAISQDIQRKRMGLVETPKTDADRYRKALEEIEEIANVLITETNESDSCYYKDECGPDCYPKRRIIELEKQEPQGRTTYCQYETVDKILNIINKAKGEEDD